MLMRNANRDMAATMNPKILEKIENVLMFIVRIFGEEGLVSPRLITTD